MILNLRRTAAVAAFCLLASWPAAATAAGGVPQHRVIGQSTLASFEVTLVATRGPSSGGVPRATVTAADYQRSGTGWLLISRKTVSRPGQWFWRTAEVCSLTTTQLVNLPEGPGDLADLVTPGESPGCLQPPPLPPPPTTRLHQDITRQRSSWAAGRHGQLSSLRYLATTSRARISRPSRA